jgi:hypothetical protein
MSKDQKVSNEVLEDFLEVDPEIPGQKFACVSFISPSKVLKKKETFMTSKFLEHVFTSEDRAVEDMRKTMMGGDKSMFEYSKVNEMFEDWKYTREQALEEEFHKMQNFQTSIQGLKVRGVYSTEQEARVRAKKLHQNDKNFHVFVCPVGYWCPWDPNPDAIKEQEHQENELNTLAKHYFENQQGKDELYQKVKQEQMEKARKELEERKKKLREETEMNVKDNTAEDIKNVEELRKIVDEGDKKFYETVHQNTTSELEKQEKTLTEAMKGLSSEDDPWVQRKKEQAKSSESQDPESTA